MSESSQDLPISADLLEILRDPAAVQEPHKYGEDPGRLTLVHNSWLVSEDTGYKYPIRDGIPVMLVEEGARWKDTPIDKLPVPPEAVLPDELRPTANSPYPSQVSGNDLNPLLTVIGVSLGIILVAGLWRWLTSDRE